MYRAKCSIRDEFYIYCARLYKRIMNKEKVVIISLSFKNITDDKKLGVVLTALRKKFWAFCKIKIDRTNSMLIGLNQVCFRNILEIVLGLKLFGRVVSLMNFR